MRTIKLAIALTLLATLQACAHRTYQSYPAAQAASERVHAAFAERSQALQALESTDPEAAQQSRRYLMKVMDKQRAFDLTRVDILSKRLRASDARQLDQAMVIGYQLLETLARFPGRLNDEGEPADKATEEALASLKDTDPAS